MTNPLLDMPDDNLVKKATALYYALMNVDGAGLNFKYDSAEQAVKRALDMEVNAAAKKIFLAEQSNADLDFLSQVENLAEVLARPDVPVRMRIQDLMIVGHNTTVAAPAKTGKTVLQANRVRSYVDNVPFLGRYEVVTPLQGNVAVWNYELSETQMHSWMRRIGIKNADRVRVANLRGKGYMLQDDLICELTINWLKQHEIEIWEIDPLQAALRGSVNDDAVAAEWIQNVERVKAEAGVQDLVLTVHMGHAASYKDADKAVERAIGSARWMGWPDNMWSYMRGDEGINFLKAQGRDVEVSEFGVDWDPETYVLTSRGESSSRSDQSNSKAWRKLRDRLTEQDEVANESLMGCAGSSPADRKLVRHYLMVMKDANLAQDFSYPKEPGVGGAPKKGWKLTPAGRSVITEATTEPPRGYNF